jgi:hypothetical protein
MQPAIDIGGVGIRLELTEEQYRKLKGGGDKWSEARSDRIFERSRIAAGDQRPQPDPRAEPHP